MPRQRRGARFVGGRAGDQGGALPNVAICGQREGCHAPRVMTGGASSVEQRGDVVRKGRGGRGEKECGQKSREGHTPIVARSMRFLESGVQALVGALQALLNLCEVIDLRIGA